MPLDPEWYKDVGDDYVISDVVFKVYSQLDMLALWCELVNSGAETSMASPTQFENNYFTEMCSGSDAGSYLRLIFFVFHSTLGLRIMKKKKKKLTNHTLDFAGFVCSKFGTLRDQIRTT